MMADRWGDFNQYVECHTQIFLGDSKLQLVQGMMLCFLIVTLQLLSSLGTVLRDGISVVYV